MARFSIGTAINDGFGLIGRRPLAVWVWGLLLMAPGAVGLALVFPAMAAVFADMPAPGDEAAADAMTGQMLGQMMQFQLASMLSNIGQLLVMAVVDTAVFRAVLRPLESSVFSLRIGMDELRVAVVGLAIGVGLYVAMMVFIMVGLAIGFAVWTSGDPAVLAVTVTVMALIMVALLFLALARVSMMAPASVLYRDFAFAQGWRLAAGQMLPLFGMMLLILLVILLVEAVVVVAGVTAFFGAGALGGFEWTPLPHDANPFALMTGWVAANWYWAVLAGAVASFIYGVLITMSVAPFASACRQLAESGTASPADEQSPAVTG